MTVKNILFYFLIFFSLILIGCASSNCSRYKNGQFFMYSPTTKSKIIIERNDTLQVETNTQTGEVTKSRITWLNPCEYKIITISNNKIYKDGVDGFFSRTPLNVKIIKTGNDFYVFKMSMDSVLKHVEYSDTIRVLK